QLRERFRPEVIARPCEADGFWDADLRQGVVDPLDFVTDSHCLAGLVEYSMRPGVVSDLEAASVEIGNIVPAEKVLFVVHPGVGDEECCLKAKLLEQRSDELDLRFDGIIERKHDGLVRYRGLRHRTRGRRDGDKQDE